MGQEMERFVSCFRICGTTQTDMEDNLEVLSKVINLYDVNVEIYSDHRIFTGGVWARKTSEKAFA